MFFTRIGLCVQGYGHTVERHVPYGFLPSCLVIFHEPGLYACSVEVGTDLLHERSITARVVGQVDLPVALVVDAAWLRLGRADEGQSCGELHIGESALHVFLYADAVLYEHHQRLLVEQGREERGKQVVVYRLQAHQHHIGLWHQLRVVVDEGLVQME